MHNEVEPTVNEDREEVKHFFSLELLKDTAFIGGLITVIAYFVTYSYEKGYNSYFHIENNFINEISITNVVNTVPSIGFLFLILLLLFYFFNVFFPPESQNPIVRVFRKEFAYLNFTFFSLLLINAANFEMVKLYLIFTLFINLVISSIIFFTYRKTKGFKAKLVKYLESNPQQQSFFTRFPRFSIHTKLILLTVIFYALPNVSEMYGRSQAKLKEDYLVINQAHPMLVVKEYKDYLIVAPLDKSKAKVTPKYRIIEYNSSLKEPLELESIRFKDGITVEEPVQNK
ncbi:hypothetical protein CN689_00970 [Peribacillus butanolivorans]|uniref:Uncharacterized protein n=1 Tax=Peribacillus butanolivorans TaxID=421767 RepID=A0AAX0S6B7_9BACI|nr:hypothetical protein [Peribacillus butanolivorans]PEJ37504.1 hypothetical protein CN689_00970 [Peribacillus butanolivorans]